MSGAPTSLVIGLGVETGTPPEHLREAIERLASEDGVHLADVAALATVTDRAAEPAVVDALAWLRPTAAPSSVALWTYPYPVLATVEVPHPSAVVRRLTGSGSVAEAAALLAARELGDGSAALVVPKRRGRGVTVAVARTGR